MTENVNNVEKFEIKKELNMDVTQRLLYNIWLTMLEMQKNVESLQCMLWQNSLNGDDGKDKGNMGYYTEVVDDAVKHEEKDNGQAVLDGLVDCMDTAQDASIGEEDVPDGKECAQSAQVDKWDGRGKSSKRRR